MQNLTVRKLPEPPEAPEEPDMNAVYVNAYKGKVDDLVKLIAKAASSKDGAKIIKRLPGFDGKNDIKELQKNPDAFIKSFLKNEEDLEELLDTIQDSKLGDKLITLLEKTPAGEALFKDIAENIENELSEYNEAMLHYEDQLTAYETALDDFINPAFLPKEDEAATDQIIAEAEAEAEAELIAEEAEEAMADALAEAEVEAEFLVSEEEATEVQPGQPGSVFDSVNRVVQDAIERELQLGQIGAIAEEEIVIEEEVELLEDEEIIFDEEIIIEEDAAEVSIGEETTQG
jgi:hypothetical protein